MGQRLTPLQALIKAKKYCAYQERCHFEVRNKLYEWGLYRNEVDDILSKLIQDDFLNEQRFAEAFSRGKFRIKNWGKNKIKAELRARQVTDYCINKGLEEIDDTEYVKVLKKVLDKRLLKETESNQIKRKQKLATYLSSRGFESDLIWEIINQE